MPLLAVAPSPDAVHAAWVKPADLFGSAWAVSVGPVGGELRTFEMPGRPIVAWSPAGDMLCAAGGGRIRCSSADGTLTDEQAYPWSRLWDARPVALAVHGDVRALAFADGRVWIWEGTNPPRMEVLGDMWSRARPTELFVGDGRILVLDHARRLARIQ